MLANLDRKKFLELLNTLGDELRHSISTGFSCLLLLFLVSFTTISFNTILFAVGNVYHIQ